MTDDQHPDYSDLLRSPYEPDPEHARVEGESDIDWRAPVVAAIVGALLVSAYVVFAIVTGPDGSDAAVDETTSTTVPAVEPVQSSDLPDGYIAATEDVGFRIENITSTPDLMLAISSAVAGGVDGFLTAPVDIAYWVIAHDDREIPMRDQRGGTGALGNHTVTWGFPDLPPSPEILGYPVEGVFTLEESLTLEMQDLPIDLEDHEIDLGADRSVVIDHLAIGDGWGSIEWTAHGTVAKVDVIVTFVGTDDPSTEEVDETLLTPSHLKPLTYLSGPRSLPPLYNFEMADQLTRSGQPISGDNMATSIGVSFTITVPESIGDPISLPLPESP